MKRVRFKKTVFLELNEAYAKVLHWFFSYPTMEIGLNDLKKLMRISKTTANRVVSQLKSEGFLRVQKIGALWRISCDQKHVFNTTRKIPYNLGLIYSSEIIESILANIPNARFISLYGSYRKGDDVETSDIDLAVEVLDQKKTEIMRMGIIPTLGYREHVKVNVLLFSRKSVDVNLFSNIANGIVLYGFLEVNP